MAGTKSSVERHAAKEAIEIELLESSSNGKSLEEIAAQFNRRFPDEPKLSRAALSRYRIKLLATPTAVETESGEIEYRGTIADLIQKLDQMSANPLDHLDLTIKLSMMNMLREPHKVSARAGLDAAALKLQYAGSGDAQEEFRDMWLERHKTKVEVKQAEPKEPVIEAEWSADDLPPVPR